MSLKIKLLKELISYVESFDDQSEDVDIKKFALYLNTKIFQDSRSEDNIDLTKADYLNYKEYKEIEFSTLLTSLFRFAKHYLKKTFHKRKFKTIDEFGFLANLLKEGSLLKNELINNQLLEMSTGSEVLKRMIKNGLIKEFPDTDDKRAKRVTLTNEGRKEVTAAFDEMFSVAKIIRGNISDDELNEALRIFNKLTYFHKDIWRDDKDSSLTNIYNKYASNSSISE